MTDPISITADVVGITASAHSASRLLYNDIRAIKNAPKAVSDLVIDVERLIEEIELVKGIGPSEWDKLGANTADHTKTMLVSCEKTCTAFSDDLKRWVRSSEGKSEPISPMNHFKLGFYRQKEIESFRQQAQICKLSFTETISMAGLYSSIRNGSTGEEINKMLISSRQSAKDQNGKLKSQIEAVGQTFTELMVLDENPEPSEDNNEIQDREAVMSQIREERTAIFASKKLLQELIGRSEQEIEKHQPLIMQTNRFGHNDKGFQTGTNSGGISLTVGDNRSTATGVANEQSIVGSLSSKNTGKPQR